MSVESRVAPPARQAGTPGDLAALICDEVARQILARHPHAVRAVVVTGSLARGESTVSTEASGAVVLGDAEFLVVFADQTPLPGAEEAGTLASEIEHALRARGVACPITLSPVHSNYLRALRPHIFAYELRSCGRVVAGDPDVLAQIPDFGVSAIPLEDAWRLLCNRLVEQLEIAPGQAPPRYRTAKLHLDMATSLLLFTGGYEPTYRQREARLRALRADSPADALPFPLGPFSERVSLCTRWKLDGSTEPPDLPAADAIGHARRLWRWELARLTAIPTGTPNPLRPDDLLPDHVLMDRWMHQQPLAEQARGWLYLLRRLGWHRSWQEWPRWSRLGRQGSPRYWVYAAACRLLFQLPDLQRTGGDLSPGSAEWTAIARALPVLPPAGPCIAGPAWWQLAEAVAWNYRTFLVDTRA